MTAFAVRFLGTRALAVASVLVFSRSSEADDRLLTDATWRYRATSDLGIDGGIVFALPSALPVGLATGAGVGFTKGRTFAWGARAAFVTTNEDSDAWAITHHELRLHAIGALQYGVGRGTFALRLGAGGVLVAEHRERHQGMRAGLTGDDLETSTQAMLPQTELDAVIALHIRGAWLMQLSGGPTLTLLDGDVHPGWSAALGVTWQP